MGIREENGREAEGERKGGVKEGWRVRKRRDGKRKEEGDAIVSDQFFSSLASFGQFTSAP